MLKAYQNAMGAMELPPEARCRILRDLTAAKPPRRRPVFRAALIAAVLVLALGMTAGAVTLASFFSGGVNDGGLDAAELKILVRGENGRVLLTTPDGEIDVTELCSESEPYLYEFTDEAGVVHIIACGGTAEDCGFAEFLCDGQTGAIDAQGWVGTGGRPDWLTRAEQLLGLRE